jgi:hypothetical protein
VEQGSGIFEARRRERVLLTVTFIVATLGVCAYLILFADRALIDGGDAYNGVVPFHYIGAHATAALEFFWTDDLGLGYPLMNELTFQQLNPLNALYLVLDPLMAFHVQIVIWLGLALASSWFLLPRIFHELGELERAIYLCILVTATPFTHALGYQIIFSSSFAILPFVWLQTRAIFTAGRPSSAFLFFAGCLLLINTQYNFTLVPNLFMVGLIACYEFSILRSKSRRAALKLVSLLALLAGFGIFYIPDALEILRLSNRSADLAHLTLRSEGARSLGRHFSVVSIGHTVATLINFKVGGDVAAVFVGDCDTRTPPTP